MSAPKITPAARPGSAASEPPFPSGTSGLPNVPPGHALDRRFGRPTTVAGRPENASSPVRRRCRGAPGCCFGRTDRNPFGPADRWLLIGCVGGAVLQRRLGHPRPYEPKSAQPTGSLSLLGGVLTGAPPWLEAFEVHQRHSPNCTSGGRAVSRRRRVAVRRCGVGIRRQEQQEVKQKQDEV